MFLKKKRVASREEIKKIIPYSSDIIFLDNVFKSGSDYIGDFLVTEQSCGQGSHKIGGEHLVFRGADIPEMAAQLLGVVWAIEHSDFIKGKVFAYSKINQLSLKEFIIPNDLLQIKIKERDIRHKILSGPEEEKMFVVISGKKFLFTVGKEKKASIGYIKCVIATPEALGLVK